MALAIVYDELLRSEVENKRGQLGTTFDFTEMMVSIDDTILRRAKRSVVALLIVCTGILYLHVFREYDSRQKAHATKGAGKGDGGKDDRGTQHYGGAALLPLCLVLRGLT